jgi:hypothetical protein
VRDLVAGIDGLERVVLRGACFRDGRARPEPGELPRCTGKDGESSRFIAGEPMNVATKVLTGSCRGPPGEPICCSTPFTITAMRSPIVIASTWSCVTSVVVSRC